MVGEMKVAVGKGEKGRKRGGVRYRTGFRYLLSTNFVTAYLTTKGDEKDTPGGCQFRCRTERGDPGRQLGKNWEPKFCPRAN